MRLRSRSIQSTTAAEAHSNADVDYPVTSSVLERAVLGDATNRTNNVGEKRDGEKGFKTLRAGKKSKVSFNPFAPPTSLEEATSKNTEEQAMIGERNENEENHTQYERESRRTRVNSNLSSAPRAHPSRQGNRGCKRTVSEESEPDNRDLKRPRCDKEEENRIKRIVSDDEIQQQRVSRGRASTRARAQDNRPHRHSFDEGTCERREDQEPRNLESEYLVHPDYRLQRASYDGNNHTLGIAKHDEDDADEPLLVSDYVTDIFQHLFNAETRSRPRMYMDKQRDINAKMRAILVDWLVEVHMKFRLVPETLYLCVNIIDRYCNQVPVARSKLQLVGVTALLIACKYEEIYPPEVRDCVYITDRAYHKQEVLDMEQDMLHRLRFKITVPTAYPFILRFLNITKASSVARYAAHYYMERTLQEHDLLLHRPSLVCAASVVLALNNPDIIAKESTSNRERPGVPKILLEYTGFSKSDILECAAVIARKVGEEPVTASRRQLVAVKRKYDNRKYFHVSSNFAQPSVQNICPNAIYDQERE